MSPALLDLSPYRNIVVLTGAGISAASGLQTYRGPDGLWTLTPGLAAQATARAADADPGQAWRLFAPMREAARRATPNAAHLALAEAERRLRSNQRFLLVTQNVDGLHQRAGSRSVAELHGSLFVSQCSRPGCALEPFADASTGPAPACPRCGALLRPGVVLFDEALPVDPSYQAKVALRDCDLFLAIGTSGTVSPAANYVRSAEYAGARTVLVNLEPMSPPNPYFREQHLGRAEELLPALLGLAGAMLG